MKNLILKVLKHDLITGSVYIFIGSTVSSLLALFLNIFFTRSLTYQEYGTYSALVSLVTLLIIPSSSLSPIIARYATMFFVRKENAKAGAFYIKSFKALLIFSVSLSIIFLLLFPIISSFLKINQLGLIIIVVFSVVSFYFGTLNMAFIQSLLRFKFIGTTQLLAGIIKLISGVLFVILGFHVYGAIFATFAFSFVIFLFSILPLIKVVKDAGKEVSIGINDFTRYAIPTTITIFALSSFITTDVLLVKHFFSSTNAGLYGGLALIGRVIFYFTGPIAITMFPLIVKRHSTNERFQNLFLLAILIVIIPSVGITGFYFLFPEFTIKIFLGGGEYLHLSKYLWLFGIFMTIFSLNNLFVNFFLSIKKTAVSLITLSMATLQIVLIYLFHENFYQIIHVSISTSLLLLVFLVLYYLKVSGSKKLMK